MYCNKVFVYGTLKRGHGNHSVMQRAGGHFLGDFTTEPKYKMLDLGAFPGVIDGDLSIKGEVYSIEDIEPIDWLEGYPELYDRRIISTPYGPAWMYTINNVYLDGFCDPVENGDW